MGALHARARLGEDAARSDRELAAEPAQRGQHPAAVEGADRPVLGPASSSRSTTTPTGRCSARSTRTALGLPARECWSEIWDVLEPLFDGVVRHRRGVLGEGPCCSRSSATAIPRRPTSTSPTTRCATRPGAVGGVFCIVSETTGRVVGERRLARCATSAASATARTARRRAAQRVRVLAHYARTAVRRALQLACATVRGSTRRGIARRRRPQRSTRDRARWPPAATDARAAVAASRGGLAEAQHAALAPRRRAYGYLVAGINPQRRVRRRTTRDFLGLVAGQHRHRDRQRARATRRSAGAPRRSPSSTARRRRSSATSATSSARRSR